MSRRFFRAIALLTLCFFVSMRVSEAVHKLRPDHVEARCELCQVILHAPAAGHSAPLIQPRQSFSLVAAAHFQPAAPLPVPAPRGRSPPAA